MTPSARQPAAHQTLTPALLGVMVVALFGFGTFFMNYATLVSVGTDMGLTAVTAGTVLTVMMVAVVAIQPAAPLVLHRVGPRTAFLIALGLQALGNLLSLVTMFPLFALVAGSVVGGLGFGVLVVIGTAVVPTTVAPHRLGKALGFFGATTATATAIGAPVGLWLVEILTLSGFRILVFALVVLALPALWFIPGTPYHGTQSGNTDDDERHVVSPIQWTGLIIVLLPVAVVLTTFGLVLAFGPAAQDISPALYIVSMQIFTIIGRFLASSSLDRYAPVKVMNVGILIALIGLIFTALLPGGIALACAMMVLGFGIGSVQAASLLLCFSQAGSSSRGSVAWNMTFDIGLGLAGLVGGFGFTYWGPAMTYILCALALTVFGLLFMLYFLSPRRHESAPAKTP